MNSSLDFKVLFESIPSPYLILMPDANFTIVAVSQGYLEATMTKREEILGRGLFDVFPDNPDDPGANATANLRASLERVLKNLAQDTMDIQKYDIRDPFSKDGRFEVRYWSPVNSPVLNEDRTIKYLVHHVEDVTEFVRMKLHGEEQEKLTKGHILINEELSKALNARDEFLAIASHELKTPITSLKLQNQIEMRNLIKGNEAVFLKAHRLNQTDKQISRLERLINDMLDISRMRTGKLTMVKETFDLCEVVKDVVDRFKEQFIDAKAQLPSFINCPPIIGNWDRIRIEQVVTNLLSNALRYGRGQPVLIRLEANDHMARLVVKDQGMGISKENQARIFDRFVRAVNTSEIRGLGIGLYIAQQIVKSHHGKISVESELERGSTFYVDLPISET